MTVDQLNQVLCDVISDKVREAMSEHPNVTIRPWKIDGGPFILLGPSIEELLRTLSAIESHTQISLRVRQGYHQDGRPFIDPSTGPLPQISPSWLYFVTVKVYGKGAKANTELLVKAAKLVEGREQAVRQYFEQVSAEDLTVQ